MSKDPFAPAAPARPGHQPLAGFAIVVRKAASGQGLARLELASAGKSISVQSGVGGEILTTDPMDQFWNPYSYVGGDPLTATDPLGLFSDGQGSLDMTSPGVFSGGDFTGPGIDLSNIGLSMPLLGTDLTLGNVLNNSRQASQDAANRAALMGQISRGDESAMMRAGVPIPGGDDPAGALALVFPLARSASAAGFARFGAAAAVEEGAVSATTPIGRRGNPLDVKPGTNSPATIVGREYSGHALDQMQGRGVMPTVVENAITFGQKGAGNTPGTATYLSGTVKVVLSSTGRVITVITK